MARAKPSAPAQSKPTESSLELLSCPFCGDAFPTLRGQSTGCWVECLKPDCRAAGGPDLRTDAIARWNRRPAVEVGTAASERAAVLAWLRKVEDEGRGSTWQWADAIERGEHIVK